MGAILMGQRMDLREAVWDSATVKAIDESKRIVEAVIVTSNPDRSGDIINIEGLDWTNFLKNPVVLWAHEKREFPVGVVKDLRVLASRVIATVEFADHEFAQVVYRLLVSGMLKGWSISILPREIEPLNSETLPGEEPAIGLRGRVGVRVKSAEVAEVSVVPIPDNPDTLTLKKALEPLETGDEIETRLLAPLDRGPSPRRGNIRVPAATMASPVGRIAVSALTKSFQERGERGKIPTSVRSVDKTEQVGTWLVLSPVKVQDSIIKEAKVEGIEVCLPTGAALSGEADSSRGEPALENEGSRSGQNPQEPPSRRHSADEVCRRASVTRLRLLAEMTEAGL